MKKQLLFCAMFLSFSLFVSQNALAVPFVEAGGIYYAPIDLSSLESSIILDGSRSLDDDLNRSLVSYEWDLDMDGTFDAVGGKITWTHSFSAIPVGYETFSVKLRVTNDIGQTQEDTAEIWAKTTPTAPYADPGGAYSIFVGENLQIDGSNSFDFDEGAPFFDNIVRYEWDLNYDGTTDITSVDPTTLILWTDLASYGLGDPGIYTLSLKAQDALGLTNTQSTFLRISEQPSPVPVPPTILLLGTGLAGLIGIRRKKFKK